jgi:hypothetical protein
LSLQDGITDSECVFFLYFLKLSAGKGPQRKCNITCSFSLKIGFIALFTHILVQFTLFSVAWYRVSHVFLVFVFVFVGVFFGGGGPGQGQYFSNKPQ